MFMLKCMVNKNFPTRERKQRLVKRIFVRISVLYRCGLEVCCVGGGGGGGGVIKVKRAKNNREFYGGSDVEHTSKRISYQIFLQHIGTYYTRSEYYNFNCVYLGFTSLFVKLFKYKNTFNVRIYKCACRCECDCAISF